MSDIRNHAVAATGRLELRGANDEPMFADGEGGNPDPTKRMAIVLYGPGSRQYAVAQAAQQNRLLDKMKRKGKTEQTSEQKAAENAEFLAACTQSFEHIECDGLAGSDLYKAVYSDATIGFVAEQAGKFLGDWANFLPKSTTA